MTILKKRITDLGEVFDEIETSINTFKELSKKDKDFLENVRDLKEAKKTLLDILEEIEEGTIENIEWEIRKLNGPTRDEEDEEIRKFLEKEEEIRRKD